MSEQLIKTPGVFGENGNFLLERELGSGGMGGVYMGRDKMLDRPVAVKVMLKEYGSDPEFVEKFKREAQSAARLIHPNIAQVYSYGICDGMPYIAMELATGGSLYSIMQAAPGKTDVTRVIKICQQVALALQCASDQGCVHGDVKPENILLDANGNAKLVDFGLAGMQKNTDEIWGTPYYISPEKVKKEPIDFRADMYSLGGTLYHALTGVAPFEGEDSIAVVKARFAGPPKKPSEVRQGLTPAIDAMVMKMLALNKEDRYPSFEALLDAFGSVLASGLTQPVPASASPSPAAAPASGGVRMATKSGRRPMMVRRGGMAARKSPDAAAEGGAETRSRRMRRPADYEGDDEDENGGNLLAKVLMFVFGGIVLIAALGGGLWWYVASDKAEKAAAEQRQVEAGFAKAKAAVADTMAKASRFADEFDEFAQKAIDACKGPTKEIAEMLDAAFASQLDPGPTQELLDAIAATNEPAQVEAAAPAATNAAPGEASAATNAVPGEASAATNSASAVAAEAPAASTPAAEAPAAAPAPAETPQQLPEAVVSMREIWDRAYGCQACAVRIRHAVRQLLKKGAEADDVKAVTEENARTLGKLSLTLAEMFDAIKTSKDVEAVRKGISYVKARSDKIVKQTQKRIRIEKLEKERADKKAAAEAAEKERQEKAEAERAGRVEAERSAASDKFDAIVAQGTIRQMDWKTSFRLLESLKEGMQTPEGRRAANVQERKVTDMKKMHDLFIRNLPGYVFRGNKLKGATVTSANEKEVCLDRKPSKIAWHLFYRKYPGNLNEAINVFVVKGRENAKPRLNLREWADVMTGAALTLQLVCAEVNGAVEKGESLAKKAVADFPEYQKTAQEIFPAVNFEDGEKEAEEE